MPWNDVCVLCRRQQTFYSMGRRNVVSGPNSPRQGGLGRAFSGERRHPGGGATRPVLHSADQGSRGAGKLQCIRPGWPQPPRFSSSVGPDDVDPYVRKMPDSGDPQLAAGSGPRHLGSHSREVANHVHHERALSHLALRPTVCRR